MFELPRDAATYSDRIFNRCHDLIAADIWGDMDVSQLAKWVANFISTEERYFAACILDALIYRSKPQTIALIAHLLQRVIPDLFRVDPLLPPIPESWAENLRSEVDPRLRIVTAVCQDDPPTKSAHIVARYLKRDFQIWEDWIIKAWEVRKCIEEGVRVFIFVDDFLGTGDQFHAFMLKEQLTDISDWFPVYAPLIAHEEGINLLSVLHSAVRLAPVETLGWSTHSVFNSKSHFFRDGANTPDGAKVFYMDLLERYSIAVAAEEKLGHGGLALALGFEHAIPLDSLPILWWRGGTWNPLFNR